MSLLKIFNQKKKKHYRRKSYLITKNASLEMIEAFSRLRVSLCFSTTKQYGQKGTTILITSSRPAEGKTTVTVNLALAFAEAGEKVLLLDGDVRKGRVAGYFGEKNKPGLTDYLAGQATLEEVVRSTEGGKLSFIACGSRSPRPYDILESKEMKELLRRLKDEYTYIIVDTPPILMIPDALALVSEVEGTVVVCRHKESVVSEISKTLGTLSFAKAKVLGVVVNDFSSPERLNEYGAYSYYENLEE